MRASVDGDEAPLIAHSLATLKKILAALCGEVLVNIDTEHAHVLDAVAALVLSMGVEDQVL